MIRTSIFFYLKNYHLTKQTITGGLNEDREKKEEKDRKQD